MADPNAVLDVSLQRLKAYGKLCLEDDAKVEVGIDITRLVEWIEWARPMLGAIDAGDASAQKKFDFSDVQRRHGPKSPD